METKTEKRKMFRMIFVCGTEIRSELEFLANKEDRSLSNMIRQLIHAEYLHLLYDEMAQVTPERIAAA
jgi:hypothetical protein